VGKSTKVIDEADMESDNVQIGLRFPEKKHILLFSRRNAQIIDKRGQLPGRRMKMLNRLLWAALMFCVPGATLARTTADTLADPSSMRFAWVRQGPDDACQGTCKEWIVASGPITSDTARDFDFFAQMRDVRGATLVLDSGGGSVTASLDLGRRLRQFDIVTTVGQVTLLDTPPGAELRGRLSPRGECASMCVFVLLGGAHREVPPQARVLVHEIWPGGKRYDASAENYTADEIVRIQRDVGRIARYTVDRGGDIGLFELAMRIPPWERLRALTRDEIRRLKLENVEVATLHTSNMVASAAPARTSSSPATQRGWTVQGVGRAAVLERHHPLTVEGEEIGQFALTLACGTDGKSFHVGYIESRSGQDGAPPPLKAVTLTFDGEEIPLKLGASADAPDSGDLASAASGTVARAAVERLRKDPNGVIIVGTRSAGDFRTSIRVGTAGFEKALANLPDNTCTGPAGVVSAQADR
jgi:hypothetical protein